MEMFLSVFIVAITVEAVTEWAKMLTNQETRVWMIVSLFVAELLTIASGVDLYAEIGLVFTIPYVGSILTGIFLSRGSNYIFALIEKLKNPITPTQL